MKIVTKKTDEKYEDSIFRDAFISDIKCNKSSYY